LFSRGEQTRSRATFALSPERVDRVGSDRHHTDAAIVKYPFQAISRAQVELVSYCSGHNGLSPGGDRALHGELTFDELLNLPNCNSAIGSLSAASAEEY
jgi:hypothetical protein